MKDYIKKIKVFGHSIYIVSKGGNENYYEEISKFIDERKDYYDKKFELFSDIIISFEKEIDIKDILDYITNNFYNTDENYNFTCYIMSDNKNDDLYFYDSFNILNSLLKISKNKIFKPSESVEELIYNFKTDIIGYYNNFITEDDLKEDITKGMCIYTDKYINDYRDLELDNKYKKINNIYIYRYNGYENEYEKEYEYYCNKILKIPQDLNIKHRRFTIVYYLNKDNVREVIYELKSILLEKELYGYDKFSNKIDYEVNITNEISIICDEENVISNLSNIDKDILSKLYVNFYKSFKNFIPNAIF